MSNNNWLERDPSQSPGLRRIQEVQQAAVLAKTQEVQRARQAEIAKIEAERQRLEMIARIEQKTAQVLPLLEEIKDFANRSKTYPLGDFDPSFLKLERGIPQLIVQATNSRIRQEIFPGKQAFLPEMLPDLKSESTLQDIEEIVSFKYGFLGEAMEEDWIGHGDNSQQVWRRVPATINYGICLKIKGTSGETEILRQKRVTIPERSLGKGGRIMEHEEIVNDWRVFPDGEAQRKLILAEAFHDPVRLGVGELPRYPQEVDPQPKPKLQTDTGIGGLVKGFLGIK